MITSLYTHLLQSMPDQVFIEGDRMNITESEQPVKIIAKTCGCKDKGTKK